MRDRVPDEATCAICGRHFDPSETRGWCPNPSCGEWQHPSFPIDEASDDSQDEETEQPSESSPAQQTCPNCGNQVRAAANFCKHCATQLTGENTPQPESETAGGESAIEECPDCSADLTGIPQDSLSTCPICMFDLTPVLEDDRDADTDSEPQPGLTECPNCGEDLTQIPADMRTVCPGCRVDLEEGLEADTEPSQQSQSQSQPSQQPSSGQGTDRSPNDQRDDTITAATQLTAVSAIAAGYVQRLVDSGVETVGDLVSADPDTVSAQTGISAQRIRGWIEDVPVDPGHGGQQHGQSGTDYQQPQTGGQTRGNQSRSGGGRQTRGNQQSGGGRQSGHNTNRQQAPSSGSGGGTQPQSGTPQETQSGAGDEETDDGIDHQSTRIQRSPELVLAVMGQELTVSAGSTVGREVREAMVDAGASEEDAVYVHRKHIRVERDEHSFFLTRLGENSLTVDGETVEKGDSAWIDDGDEICFSDVVTATVSIR